MINIDLSLECAEYIKDNYNALNDAIIKRDTIIVKSAYDSMTRSFKDYDEYYEKYCKSVDCLNDRDELISLAQGHRKNVLDIMNMARDSLARYLESHSEIHKDGIKSTDSASNVSRISNHSITDSLVLAKVQASARRVSIEIDNKAENDKLELELQSLDLEKKRLLTLKRIKDINNQAEIAKAKAEENLYDEYLQREGYGQRPSGTHPTHITDFHPTHISDPMPEHKARDSTESMLNPRAEEFAPLQPQRLSFSPEIPPKLPTDLKEYIREYVKPDKQSPESVLPTVTPTALPTVTSATSSIIGPPVTSSQSGLTPTVSSVTTSQNMVPTTVTSASFPGHDEYITKHVIRSHEPTLSVPALTAYDPVAMAKSHDPVAIAKSAPNHVSHDPAVMAAGAPTSHDPVTMATTYPDPISHDPVAMATSAPDLMSHDPAFLQSHDPVHMTMPALPVPGYEEYKKGLDLQKQLIESLQLPSAPLPEFTGSPLDYSHFMNVFQTTVDRTSLPFASKLNRLYGACSPKVQTIIASCLNMPPEDGYKQALSILKRRFGDDFKVAKAWIDSVSNGKSLNENDREGLQELADRLNNCKIVLESLGKVSEIEGGERIKEVAKKLPLSLRRKWRDKASEHYEDFEDYPSFAKFVEFVAKKARSANDPLYGDILDYEPDRKQYRPRGESLSFSTQASEESPSRSLLCAFCKSPSHENIQCEKLKGMEPEQRLAEVNRHRLCFSCLEHSHQQKDCTKLSTCTEEGCTRRHNPLLHHGLALKTAESPQDRPPSPEITPE